MNDKEFKVAILEIINYLNDLILKIFNESLFSGFIGSILGAIVLFKLASNENKANQIRHEANFKQQQDFIALQHQRVRNTTLLNYLAEYVIYTRCILSKYLDGYVHTEFTNNSYPLNWTTLHTLRSLVEGSINPDCAYKQELLDSIKIINRYAEFIWQDFYLKKPHKEFEERLTTEEYYKKMGESDRFDSGSYKKYFENLNKKWRVNWQKTMNAINKLESFIVKIGSENK